jgi:hypothetical protein
MERTNHVPYGLLFTVSLLLSWTLVTAAIALGFRAGPRSLQAGAQWAGLWFFTVAAPTIQALRIHRRLNDIVRECPASSPQIRRELEHARFVILMCGSLCVLLVFGLLVK